MKNQLLKLNGLLMAMLLLVACGGDDPDDPDVPVPQPTPTGSVTISTPQVTDVTHTSAVVKAEVSATGGASVTSRGFCYATTPEPTTSDRTQTAALNDMEVTLTNLDAATTYYVRGYAQGSQGVVYSATATFTTAAAPQLTLDDWTAPAYADDYRNSSGWNDRAKWNLANVHDPTVMLADDGYYYMYQTDASFGNAHDGHGHFHGRRSKDLINWEYLGGTMATVPAWVKDSLNSQRARVGLTAINNPQHGYWAPTARKVRTGLYRMYYSIVTDNYIQTGKPANQSGNFDNSWGERAFIGLMETADPASNNWVDKGYVICSSSDKGFPRSGAAVREQPWYRPNDSNWQGFFRFNAIDPSYIITPKGEHWLVYGSWHSGFAAVQLNPETGKTLNALPEPYGTAASTAAYGKLVNTRKAGDRWQGSEGPEVVYHDGYYYMFMAYDALDVPYNTRVVRSENVDGPYKGINGTNVTTGGDAYPVMTHPYKFGSDHGWVGISHCAVWDDGKDNWYYASQGRYPADFDNWAPNAIMLGHVRRVLWTPGGWPVVLPERYAAVPQVAIAESELVGTWQNISLDYDYGKQKGSVDLTLNSNNTVSGAPFNNQKWSFDAASNVLTIGSVQLVVARECDWEASPRRHTLVYAGVTTDRKTYWGKKK